MLHGMDVGYGLGNGYRVEHWIALDVALDCIGCRITLDTGLHSILESLNMALGCIEYCIAFDLGVH